MSTAHSVRDLQHMLRLLSRGYPQLPAVTADGIFGENTLEAVLLFQRDLGLPVTGTVDQNTWDAMDRQCALLSSTSVPPPFYDPNALSFTGSSDQTTLLRMVRFIFNTLSRTLGDFSLCEVNTPAFSENLRTLQRISALPVTGSLDNATWQKLLCLFRLFIVRGRHILSR